jgi:hypothetical protein
MMKRTIASSCAPVVLFALFAALAQAQPPSQGSGSGSASSSLPAPAPVPPPPTGPFGSGGDHLVSPRIIVSPPAGSHDFGGPSFDAACTEPCNALQLEAGASLYVLRPFFQANPAFYAVSGTENAQGGAPDFQWDTSATPAIWLALTSPEGWGFRSRYFRFDQKAHAVSTSLTQADAANNAMVFAAIDTSDFFGTSSGFTAPGFLLDQFDRGTDQIVATSRLQIDTIDFEGTWTFHPGEWTLLPSFGLRYLHTNQDYSITLSNQATIAKSPVTELQTENYGHNFSGLGPTVALEAKCPIEHGGFSVYGNVRGSLLVGTQHEYLAWAQQVSDPGNKIGGSFTDTAAIPFSHSQVFPVLEGELGLEFQHHWGTVNSTFRLGLVTQNYFDAGNASMNDANLNLFGFQFSAGLGF